jgi:hypothetical protein
MILLGWSAFRASRDPILARHPPKQNTVFDSKGRNWRNSEDCWLTYPPKRSIVVCASRKGGAPARN